MKEIKNEINLYNLTEEEKSGLADQILFLEENRVDKQVFERLFGKNYIPGTFMIGERKNRPLFINEDENTLGYSNWIKKIIISYIVTLESKRQLIYSFDSDSISEVVNKANLVLKFKLKSGKSLEDSIPNQIYSDIFIRIINLLLFNEIEIKFYPYKEANELGRKIAVGILSSGNTLNLKGRLLRSINSGVIGLDKKDDINASSRILSKSIFKIGGSKTLNQKIKIISFGLNKKIKNGFGIDFFSEFEKEVLNINKPTNVVYITDDYIETIFDLDFIQSMLNYNKNLNVSIIARRNNYSNDSSFKDIIHLLDEKVFYKLKKYRIENRFIISKSGPLLAGFDPRAISSELGNLLLKCDIIIAKGARIYEMIQGIHKTTYYGFVVAAEFSESIVGVDASKGIPVFIRQSSGVKTFKDFKFRGKRPYVFPSGRKSSLARMTALEFSKKFGTKINRKTLETNS